MSYLQPVFSQFNFSLIMLSHYKILEKYYFIYSASQSSSNLELFGEEHISGLIFYGTYFKVW